MPDVWQVMPDVSKDHRAFNLRAEVLYCLDPEEEDTTDSFRHELLTQPHSITSHKTGICSKTDIKTSNLAFKILPSPQHLDWPWQPTSQGLLKLTSPVHVVPHASSCPVIQLIKGHFTSTKYLTCDQYRQSSFHVAANSTALLLD